MKLKKFLVYCYSGLIWNREKRRTVRQVLFPQVSARPVPTEEFFLVDDFLDMDGSGWATYMLSHNMPEKIAALRKGLDAKSNELVDLIFSRITIFPKGSWPNYKVRVLYLETLYTPEESAQRKMYSEELPTYKEKFRLDEQVYNADTFLFHTGLRNKNNRLHAYIAGKDFIDAGARISATQRWFTKGITTHAKYGHWN